MEVLAEAVLPHLDGLPKDQMVNTFAFLTPTTPATPAELSHIHALISEFYNNGTTPIAGFIGEQISRSTPVQTKLYDLTGHLNGTAHGSPISLGSFTLGASSVGTELPSELCICGSFRAAYASDVEFAPSARPRARDRGRVYLGPLTTSCMSYDSTVGRTFVSSSARNAIVAAMVTLRDDATSAWAVWSRKNAVLEPVVAVWVDDAFDIQRRRGEAAGTRTTG